MNSKMHIMVGYDDKSFTYPLRNGRIAGCGVVLGIPGCGKSALTKHIAVQTSHQCINEKVIIFDSSGEWKEQVVHSNFHRDMGFGLRRPVFLDELDFYITDFDTVHDWMGLGATEKGAEIMVRVITKCRSYHQDNPQKVKEIVDHLPWGKFGDTRSFTAKYGGDFDQNLNDSTVKALQNTVANAMDMFTDPSQSKDWQVGGRRVHDWFALLTDPRIVSIVINFPLSLSSIRRSAAYVAKVLQWISECLWDMRGLIIFCEEAQWLCSSKKDKNDQYLPSCLEFITFVKKHQKKGVWCWFVSQQPLDIHNEITSHANYTIAGLLSKRDAELVFDVPVQWRPTLRSDVIRGYRRMAFIDRISGITWGFMPMDAYCDV